MPNQPYILAPVQGSDQADEWHRLGLEAQLAGNLPLAQHRYQQALRLDPRHAMAAQNLAIIFAQSNMINEALLGIERAIMCDGDHALLRVNKAMMAMEAERIDEALAAAQEAVRLGPKDITALWALAMALTSAGRAKEAVALYNQMLDIDPKHAAAGPNSCFIQSLTDATPAELLKQRQRWYSVNRYEGKVEPHKNDRDPDRVLRVGYVGGDFKFHSAAFIFANVLFHHSPQVEMYLYSSLPVDPAADHRSKTFAEKAGATVMVRQEGDKNIATVSGGRWRDISAMSDDDAASLIRRDKIDILVDLAAHTNGGRLRLFTYKPAPIQVTAWGFAHGTGLPEIDYFFADQLAIPQDERQHYAEKVVDLPCIVTMEAPVEYQLKGTSNAPMKSNGYVTFGCYARYEKMSDECLKALGEIMRRVPDAKMQFKDHAYRRPYSIRRIIDLMPGVEPDRLLFSLETNHPDHMLAYQQADICLDPWPHGGGVVSLEQLFMGVPVITKYGTQPAGRSASSVLTAMGRTAWVAKDVGDFIETAVAWSDKPKELAEARKTLRDELLNSPVVKGYAEAVETKYREIWRRWCES